MCYDESQPTGGLVPTNIASRKTFDEYYNNKDNVCLKHFSFFVKSKTTHIYGFDPSKNKMHPMPMYRSQVQKKYQNKFALVKSKRVQIVSSVVMRTPTTPQIGGIDGNGMKTCENDQLIAVATGERQLVNLGFYQSDSFNSGNNICNPFFEYYYNFLFPQNDFHCQYYSRIGMAFAISPQHIMAVLLFCFIIIIAYTFWQERYQICPMITISITSRMSPFLTHWKLMETKEKDLQRWRQMVYTRIAVVIFGFVCYSWVVLTYILPWWF